MLKFKVFEFTSSEPWKSSRLVSIGTREVKGKKGNDGEREESNVSVNWKLGRISKSGSE